jgi:multiple sugar transport system substrate-binding protein
MKYSKNAKLAKDFIRFYMDRARFDRYFEIMDTFGIPGTKVYADHPLWKKDSKTAVFPETLKNARQVGYAGAPGRAATEALSKFIMVDMYAKAIQGMAAEDAVKWAAAELTRIYGG